MRNRDLSVGTRFLASTLSLGCLLAGPVHAQTAADAIGDIVVTAQRMEQRLQTVPLSITAQTGAELERKGVNDIADLQFSAPSLNVGPSPAGGTGSGAQIFIRGVGQIDYSATQEPDVPVYLDGVYLARPFGAVFDFLDLDRVEVLRGPQGTLFGRNAMGGAIQIISKLPDRDFSGRFKLALGRFDRRDIEGVVNVPMSDTLSLRLAGSSTDSDGYGRLLPSGTRTGDDHNVFLRGTLRWRPDGATDVVLRGERYTHRDSMSQQTLLAVTPTPLLNGYNALLASRGLPPIDGAMVADAPYRGGSGVRRPERSEAWGGSLDMSRDVGALRLKSITAYRELTAKTAFDFAALPYPYLNTQTDTAERQFSQELQLSGAAFDDRLRFVAGAYYFHERNRQTQNLFQRLDVVRTGIGAFDFAPDLNSGSVVNIVNDQITDSYAVYGQASYEILPRLTATLGVRASWDKKDLGSSAGAFSSSTSIRPFARIRDDWHQVTPRYGLDYKISDDAMLYATISHGFRSGGFNGRVATAIAPLPYDAEKLVDYEAGLKTQFLDHRLRLNLGGFYYDYKNYQANTNQLVNGAITVVVDNAAALRIYGAELEAQFQVSKAFQLGGYVSVLDPHFHDIVPTTTSIRSDSQPPNAPKFTAGAQAQYIVAIGGAGSATARIDYAYKSKTQFFLPNLPGEAQKGYGLVNARLTFRPNGDRYEFAVFGTNIFDKRYRVYGQSLASSYGVLMGVYGRPAEWGVSFGARF